MSSDVSLDVSLGNSQALRAKLDELGEALSKKILAATAGEVEEYVEGQSALHNKTGALVRSVFKGKRGDGWVVGHDLQHAPHARFVHWGTKRHVILPKNKKALRFVGGGGLFVFAKKVNHPGNKPDKWLERAAAMAPAIFARRVAEKMRTI